jgi:hypothetical protein
MICIVVSSYFLCLMFVSYLGIEFCFLSDLETICTLIFQNKNHPYTFYSSLKTIMTHIFHLLLKIFHRSIHFLFIYKVISPVCLFQLVSTKFSSSVFLSFYKAQMCLIPSSIIFTSNYNSYF